MQKISHYALDLVLLGEAIPPLPPGLLRSSKADLEALLRFSVFDFQFSSQELPEGLTHYPHGQGFGIPGSSLTPHSLARVRTPIFLLLLVAGFFFCPLMERSA